MGLAVNPLQAVANANVADPQALSNWYQKRGLRVVFSDNRKVAHRLWVDLGRGQIGDVVTSKPARYR